MSHRISAALRFVGRQGLVLAGAMAVCAGCAAVVAAFTWPAPRAGAVAGSLAAVASTIGVLTAIYLSRQALARTDRQLAMARRAVVLSRYPLVVPVHQAVPFPGSGGMVAPHPPSEERFALTSAPAQGLAFLAVARDRMLIPLENIGEGPALRIRGTLWCSDGRRGTVAGAPALGRSQTGVMTAEIHAGEHALPEEFRSAMAGQPELRIAYWLELTYDDVFENGRRLTALFDPRRFGAWHIAGGLEPGTA